MSCKDSLLISSRKTKVPGVAKGGAGLAPPLVLMGTEFFKFVGTIQFSFSSSPKVERAGRKHERGQSSCKGDPKSPDLSHQDGPRGWGNGAGKVYLA